MVPTILKNIEYLLNIYIYIKDYYHTLIKGVSQEIKDNIKISDIWYNKNIIIKYIRNIIIICTNIICNRYNNNNI